jgi:hypothetical protein
MTRRNFIALGAIASASKLPAQNLSDRVGAANDLVCQGLELLSSRSTKDNILHAIKFFEMALDQYESFADAHYYRALCLKRLNQRSSVQKSDMDAATNSAALQEQRDPFTLAVPRIFGDLGEVGNKWALVVGISKFQPDIGASALGCADKDAISIAKQLRDPLIGRFPDNDKNVALLTNDKATTSAIKEKLNYIARHAKPEDIVFVSISTHGSSRSEDIKQVSYLYTYDTDVTGHDNIFATALPMIDVANIIRTRCAAQRTVILFDTCHSGSATPSDPLSGEDMDRLRDGAGRYVLTSCSPDQNSYENGEHGYFTKSFLEVFAKHQGCVRMTDLFNAIETDVRNAVSSKLHKAQSPLLSKSENAAEIILGASVTHSTKSCAAVPVL